MSELPNSLHGLLTAATDDAVEAEKDPAYSLDMDDWVMFHQWTNTCSVCMAGALLCKRVEGLPFGSNPQRTLEVNEYPLDIANKLLAIDQMRMGCIEPAWRLLDEDNYDQDPTETALNAMEHAKTLIEDAFDHDNQRAPWEVYRQAASILEDALL